MLMTFWLVFFFFLKKKKAKSNHFLISIIIIVIVVVIIIWSLLVVVIVCNSPVSVCFIFFFLFISFLFRFMYWNLRWNVFLRIKIISFRCWLVPYNIPSIVARLNDVTCHWTDLTNWNKKKNTHFLNTQKSTWIVSLSSPERFERRCCCFWLHWMI